MPPVPGLPYAADDRMPDMDALLYAARSRMGKLLEVGYEYDDALLDSSMFLHNNALRTIRMVALFVDLVSSAKISQTLPADKLAMLVGSFVQGMVHVIVSCGGMALKYVGDAAIRYFVTPGDPQLAVTRAIRCGSMVFDVVERGINPVPARYKFPHCTCG